MKCEGGGQESFDASYLTKLLAEPCANAGPPYTTAQRIYRDLTNIFEKSPAQGQDALRQGYASAMRKRSSPTFFFFAFFFIKKPHLAISGTLKQMATKVQSEFINGGLRIQDPAGCS